MKKIACLIGVVTLLVALVLPTAVFADDVTVMFGRESNGDNASTHKLVPKNVFISVGDKVSFVVGGGPHRVAIYPDGFTPDEVVLSDGRVVLVDGTPPGGLADGVGETRRDFSYTFTQPGKYLVICSIGRHFSADGMFGWVFVEE